MTFFNTNSIKPTDKEQGVTQAGQTEKKIKDLENQVTDIDERLSQTETKVDSLDTVVNTERLTADEVHSQHDYTNELSVSGDASVSGTVNADKVTASEITATDKVKTKDIQVTNNLTVEGTGTFAQVSAENFDIETFNAEELNATELSADNADITNLASNNITADTATIGSVTSDSVTSENITVTDTITGKDAALSGDLSADDVTASNVKVSDTADVLKLIAETMQSGRLFIAPETMQLIPEKGWIHFHNVNAGRFILYLTDFTDVTTNIHSLGNVLFSAVIDYTNNNNKGNVNITYVQPQTKAFEKVYIADDGELWLKRSPGYLNARRAVVFTETEKEIIVDTYAENAQTFDVSEAKSVNLSSFDGGAEINSEKILKGNYTIDGNCYITGYLTPGQTITERSLFLGYSDLITGDNNGVLTAYGATITDDVIIGGELTVTGDVTASSDLNVSGNTELSGTLSVGDDITAGADVSVTGNETIGGMLDVTGTSTFTDDVTMSSDLAVNGNTVLKETEINGELSVDADIITKASLRIEKDLQVKGDLYVEGVTYQTEETNVSTTGDYIVTRDNNNTPLASNEYSGLAVNNYDTDKIATLTADSNGEWRVSDSATQTAQTYTNVSEFNGDWFTGLTQTGITALKGIFTNVSGDELTDVVLYNSSDYYHFDGVNWYGVITVNNGELNKGSIVTDSALITALDALTRHTLIYYASITVKQIDASTNQPLLTRAEKSTLENNDILVWDDTNSKAVNLTRPLAAQTGNFLKCNVDNQNNVTYSWSNIFDLIYPVGVIYVQYPEQKSPLELFASSGTKWTEIGSYNGAFFRSSNCPTTLYTLDGLSFFCDADLEEPIDFTGLGTVTDSGETIVNTYGDIVSIYTGSWTTGNASAFIEEGGTLTSQAQGTAINGLSGKTSDTRNSADTADKTLTGYVYSTNGYGTFSETKGIFSLQGGTDTSPSGSGPKGNRSFAIDATHSHNVSILSIDTETRPVNYTVRIWKRVS